jgi:hypothetical protein
MTARTLAQQANVLITRYVKLYGEKYGEKPTVNRYRERWGFQAAIEDLGRTDAEKAIEYFFILDGPHDIPTFLRRYDELHKMRVADEEDKRRVAKLHEETAKRVKEWQERNGTRGTSGSSGGV